jgi:ABC-type bacteriocin/lantibiotic exporter with double-glycine peptidase domain
MTVTEIDPPARSRVKVPTIRQLEPNECGAASLGMLLAHHGRFVGMDELRDACGVSRDGINVRDIITAAHSFGLTGEVITCDAVDVKRQAFPLIVNWGFNHFVVVEGWYPGGWFLNDPARGSRKCPEDEFDSAFTGLVISVQPGARFQVGGKRPSIVSRLLASAGNLGPAVVAALIVGLLLFVPTFLVPALMTIYGNGLNGLNGVAAAAVVTGLVIALMVQVLLQSVQGVLTIRLSTRINVRLAATVVDRIIRLPAAFHAQRGADSLAQRVLAIETMSAGVSSLALGIAAAVSISAIAAIVLVVIDPWVGLTALAIAGAMAAATLRYLHIAKDDAANVLVETIEVGSHMSSTLSQMEVVKAAGAEDGIIARGVASINRQLEAEQRVALHRLSVIPINIFLDGFAVIAITGIALLQIANGRLEPGSLLAVLAITGIMMGPVAHLTELIAQAQMLRPVLDQIDGILEADLDSEWDQVSDNSAPALLSPGTIDGDVRMRAVSFGYSRLAEPIITGLDLDMAPGSRVALVGPSGCGKSTISRLVVGLYRPWNGEILVDGLPRWRHAPVVLSDCIALVGQVPTIFAGTIRENITLWDPGIREHDIQRAIEDAQLARDVATRPGGLDAILTEGGANLSGGQRQRIEIARALVRNPRILVLDEATSALDPPTEDLISQAIRRRGTTCLVIAHRLSTIRDSDEIVVLNQGSVVERGTHVSLMSMSGAYAALVTAA